MIRMKITRDTRGLILTVVFLIISVTFLPSINFSLVEASKTNHLVEITTHVCGINRFKDTTIQLTNEQYQNLEQYLIQFRARMNHTTTYDEEVLIFKDAVVELNKYGLLPTGMTIEQAQRLIIERYQNFVGPIRYNNILKNFQIANTSNFFCLLTGETNETRQYGYFETGCSALSYFIYGLSILAERLSIDPSGLINITNQLRTINNLYHTLNTRRIIGTGRIAFGKSYTSPVPPPYHSDPAVGWITTQGLLGKKSWNGSFFGRIMRLLSFDSSKTIYYIGVTGFVGIKLNKSDGKFFYLGSAFRVTIE